jgi:hypothetical protein
MCVNAGTRRAFIRSAWLAAAFLVGRAQGSFCEWLARLGRVIQMWRPFDGVPL